MVQELSQPPQDEPNLELTAPSPAPPPQKSRKKLLLLVGVLLIVFLGAGAMAYTLLAHKKSSGSTPVSSTKAPVVLTPDQAFARMLQQNQAVSYYHIDVTHTAKSKSGKYAQDSDETYTYSADADVSNSKVLKNKATFDLSKSGKQAKGEVVVVGEDLYLKLDDALVTSYVDTPCVTPGYRTALSPSLTALRAGFVKTVRSDQTLSCGHGAYQDFISPITYTNNPFSDLPLLNKANLSDLQARAFTSAQAGQYTKYDGKLDTLDGKKVYSYNVTIENYRISEMSKVLVAAAGFVDDQNHIISFGAGNLGQASPGRYLKVWIDATTGNLYRVESIVNTKDVDIAFDTIMTYSKINVPVSITAPL